MIVEYYTDLEGKDEPHVVHRRDIFNYDFWESLLPSMVKKYSTNEPFPHIVLDNFLNPERLNVALNEFPEVDSKSWINYQHVSEDKYGKNKFESFPLTIKSIFAELLSERFLKFLSSLSGIRDLLADWGLEGGGLHQSKRGGFLNIHADFTAHPYNLKWKRRINLLIYLNKDWQESYGGHLELWNKKMTKCVKRIEPIFNRALIFNTDKDSYHGHPHPLNCPKSVTRKSFALYYFTEEESPVKAISTNYQALPTDNVLKKIMIKFDNVVLSTYDFFKRRFKFNDEFVSKSLRIVSLLRKK